MSHQIAGTTTTKKNPYKLKAKLTGEAPHHASEQFVNEEAITECNSHLYAAAGEIGGWVFLRECVCLCDGDCLYGCASLDTERKCINTGQGNSYMTAGM